MKIENPKLIIIAGPNGSGKTSLLMTIMGFPDYKVTSGSIIFKCMAQPPLTAVGQNPALYEHCGNNKKKQKLFHCLP